MKRKFTFLITAAVMLLTIMASTGTMWGQTEILNEPFNISGTNEVSSPYNGWAITRCWGGDGSIRLGASGGDKGQIISPALTTLSGNATMTFEVKRYGTDTGSIGISIEEGDGTVTGDVTVASTSISTDSWTTKTVTITKGSSTTKIKFLMSNKRMYLRNVIIVPSSGGNPTAANIAALTANTTAGDYELTLSNAIVTYVNGNYAYVQDASGAVQYFKNGHGLNAGDVLTGTAIVSYQLNNNNPRITNLQGITPVSGTAPEPTSLAQSAWNHTFNAVLSQYFQITGATLTKTGNYYYIALGDDNVQLYKNGGSISTLDLSKTYTVVGFPMLYNSTKEILVFENPQVEVSTDPTITVDPVALSNFTYEEGNGPSTVKTISVSGSNLTANIGLSLGDNSDYEMSTTEGSGYTNSLTLTQTGGTVNATTVYVRLKADLAVSASYSGTITLTSTDATPVSVSLSGSVTAPEAPHVTWDLSIDETTTATTTEMTWTSTYATMGVEKGNAGTNTNNYYPGTPGHNYTSTRFYANSVLTIAPVTGYMITSVVFEATTNGYASVLKNSTWTNATASMEAGDAVKTVTVTPTNGNNAMVATIGNTCGFTEVKVYYEEYEAPKHTLAVSALTNAEIDVFDATDPDDTNWELLFYGVGNVQVAEGTPIALSVSAEQGYVLTELMVNDVDHLADVNGGLYTFNMPTQDVNITATAAAIPTVMYQYSINGIEEEPVEVYVNTVIQLASGSNLNDDFTFVGWTTNANDVTNILAAGSEFTLDDTYEFYAVYAHTTGSASGAKDGASYVKVTSEPENWEGDYLLVYEDFAVEGEEELNVLNTHYGNLDANTYGTYVDIYEYYSDGVIEYNSTTSSYAITVEETDNGYSLYDNGDEAYLGNNSSTTGGRLRWDTEFVSSRNEWTLGVNSIVSVYDNDYAIRWNSSSPRFAIYKTDGQQAIQLYKYTAGGTPTPQPTTAYYTRVFLNETVTAPITITGPSIIPSGTTLDMGNYMLTNELAQGYTKLVIEDGAQLKTPNAVNGTVEKNVTGYGESNTVKTGWNFIASPINVNDLAPTNVTNMLSNNYDLYQLDPSTNYWQNYKGNTAAGFNLVNGRGYLYANSNNVTLSFAGTIKPYISSGENANNEVSLYAGWNLVGNPFTFNVFTNKSYYKITTTTIDDVEQNVITAVTNPSDAITPCTGIVLYSAAASTVTFNDNAGEWSTGNKGNIQMALAQNTIASRDGASTSSIIDNAIVSFNEGTELEKFYFGNNAANIFIKQNNEEYAIVSTEMKGEMPVNFVATEAGEYTITVNAEDVEMSYLHLIDNIAGQDIDLIATPSYTFNAQPTDYASRFRLVFSANNVNENQNENEDFAFVGSDGQLIVNGTGTIQIIDMMGRVITTRSTDERISTNGLNTGVYVLQLINGSETKTQKIMVK